MTRYPADDLQAASNILFNLAALFTAISKATDRHSHIGQLAELGQYVASDWANTTDVMSERHQGVVVEGRTHG